MKVVLDTNAALLPFSDGTDLTAELDRLVGRHEIILLDAVAHELRHLSKGQGAIARHAAMALRWMLQASRHSTALPGDDGVLEAATALQAVVVSNDKTLLSEARKRGLRVLQSRGKGRLHDPAA